MEVELLFIKREFKYFTDNLKTPNTNKNKQTLSYKIQGSKGKQPNLQVKVYQNLISA